MFLLPSRYLIVQSQQLNLQGNVWNLFKVNNKLNRVMPITSFWCLYCYLWTYFRYFRHFFGWCFRCWIWKSRSRLGNNFEHLFVFWEKLVVVVLGYVGILLSIVESLLKCFIWIKGITSVWLKAVPWEWCSLLLFCFTSLSSQPAITCSKLTIESLEQSVKYVQS